MFDRNIVKLVNKWASAGEAGIEPALRICRDLISFKPDPLEREKQARRKKSAFDWSASLDPGPRFSDWEYSQLLDQAVRPLVIVAPLRTARLLIEAVANMMRLDTGREPDAVEANKNDASEIWSPSVDQKRRPYAESKGDLVRTLTFACEKVYELGNERDADQLDAALREGRWYVFDRIRYHLYAKFPERTKAWIREAILSYRAYAKEQYGFEFQRMTRIALEQFGATILSQDELANIFEVIVNAPDKEDYKQFMADQFTEDGYRQRQEYFQYRQLRPFACVLLGKYKDRYTALLSNRPVLTDEDFVRYDVGESKTGASRSPRSIAELALLTDDELIAFLNDWDDAHHDVDEWWVDIDFTGLATAFQQLILANPNRFLGWGERWHALQRPIYFRYALDAATKRIGEHQSELHLWLDITDWVMTRSDAVPGVDEKNSETSRTHPTWNYARTQVVDVVAACVKTEVDVGLQWRPRLIALLKAACVSADYYLDSNKPIITPRDFLTDAINTMRGRAIENLIRYGFWVRRHQESADLADVFDVLQLRLDGSPPLALPECALLGMSFHQLYGLSTSWAQANVDKVFPQSNPDAWAAGFSAYLRFNSAHPVMFGMMNNHLRFALENLRLFREEKNSGNDSIEHLGQQLLDYYIFGLIKLSGPESLLQRFYGRVEPKYWADLFDHVGRALDNTHHLTSQVEERCKAFLDARLAEGNAEELQEFTFWIRASCLSPNWRITALIRVLDVTKTAMRTASMITEELAKLLQDEPDLVVSAFAKLTEGLVGQPYFYLQPEYVKPILKTGLASERQSTAEAARFAQDNLLKAGRIEFRNLDEIKDEVKWN